MLNMIVIRHTSKEMLGVVNIRLCLLQTTVLFLATEPFDLACLSKIEGKNWTQVVNLMWFTVPLSAVFGVIFGWIWWSILDVPDASAIPNFYFGVLCYALAPCIATLARPLFIVGQSFFYVRLRVATVAISEVFKCLVTVLLLILKPQLGIISFSIGQILGELLYICIYYIFFYLHIQKPGAVDRNFAFQTARDFFPKSLPDKPLVNGKMAMLTFSFFKQSLLKQMLTEGEKYVMTIFSVMSFADQGVFGIINNLGALFPRFVFQPVEESARLFFSQLLHRGQKFLQQSKDEAYLAYQVLKHLLRAMFLIGCIILVFGNSYAYLLLDIYGGKTISEGSGPLLLQWFCVYVLVLAVNGIMECFHFALMNQEDTDRYNKKMLVFSGVFLGSSLLLTSHFGGVGFILANCFTMCTRIFHSLLFINQYYKGTELHPLKSLVPSVPLLVSLFIAFVIMKASEVILCCNAGWTFRFIHIGIGGVCLGAVLIILYLTETELREFIVKHYKTPKSTKKE